MLPLQPIPPHIMRHAGVGKIRRPDGDPVSQLKDMTRFEPIPRHAPGYLVMHFDQVDPKRCTEAEKAGRLVFHSVGDTGGVHGTAAQEALAVAMEDQIKTAAHGHRPAFLYNLGDVVYFNGLRRLYRTEFYEPYQYYPALIFAIPGNHDGETHTFKGDPPDTEPSLAGFFDNFCDTTATHVSPYRMSMTQPYVYWILDAPFVTVIGLYSNVEGSLDARGRYGQQHFLQTALTTAPVDRKLIVAVHHPPFSLDAAHGGTPDILNALDRAFAKSGRFPDAVLSGHVHNYQRFSRDHDGRKIPYVVAGAGGYANDAKSMHKLQKGLGNPALPFQTTLSDVRLESYNLLDPGFLRLTADAGGLEIEYFVVPFDGGPVVRFDSVRA